MQNKRLSVCGNLTDALASLFYGAVPETDKNKGRTIDLFMLFIGTYCLFFYNVCIVAFWLFFYHYFLVK